jgi:hypothetical protein
MGQELILDIANYSGLPLFWQHSFIQRIPSNFPMIKAGYWGDIRI